MPKQAAQTTPKTLPSFLVRRLSEGGFIIALSLALFLVLSLISYQKSDPSWTHVVSDGLIRNAGGKVGAWFADLLFFIMGYLAYLTPVFLLSLSWQLLRDKKEQAEMAGVTLVIRVSGFLLFLIGSCGLASAEFNSLPLSLPHGAGGIIGQSMLYSLNAAFNNQGALLLLVAIVLIGITLLTGLSWVWLTEEIGRYCLIALRSSYYFLQSLVSSFREASAARKKKQTPVKVEIKRKPKPKKEKSVEIKPKKKSAPVSKRFIKEQQVPLFESHSSTGLPALNLLDKATKTTSKGYSNDELEEMSRDVEQNLQDFGVQAQVVAVHPGPVITRFELELAAGQKVSKLTALAKDLARSLSVTSVRVVEVIPGKSVVGLELPNKHREVVRLSEVLNSESFDQARSPLSLALGVDIAGHSMVVDLAKMPHLLVAGTTGSGKSVGINAMLLSLLFKSSPEEVRLILVDPKMLELSIYDGIPHLLTPVVTDMKEAANALRWSVGEMERRYKLMASLGVRNINGYNNKVKEARAKGEPLLDPLWTATTDASEAPPELTNLPYIVVVIDELADMMMVVGKKVEQLIARIAQKARAAGIHLILATQRPSVDVLTGLIKSNVPTRISFQVSSKIDSRTILDQQGAEQLLGHGDMLYLAPGTGAPLRVHGAFVDDKEVHRVTEDWRGRGQPEFIEDITIGSGDLTEFGDEGGNNGEESDPLYDEAVEFVTQTRKASISAVQRRLKVGYNRAARLVEDMEKAGVVGPMDSGGREVLAPPPPEN